ncbi:MAG: hypothetical protein JNM21_17315 [Taibaiella sp.]|nr:hypothetical protein [Taibaiella sp.]
MKRPVPIFFILLALAFCFNAGALYAEPNATARYGIRAKRGNIKPDSEEGLAASREFIRSDSTYYVGWMFQGIYQSERAADFLGYKNAIVPLDKALGLIEKDYAKELGVKTADPYAYFKVQQLHMDYSTIAYYLFQAYQNADMNEQSYALIRRVQKQDLQKNWMLEPYNMLSWITHRNRFYTSATYSFLKDDIAANEQLANAYLDSALLHTHKYGKLNSTLFSEFYNEYEQLSVYHYKCILHAYNFQLDSAAHYFSLMEGTTMFPYNNHGTFLSIQARFKEAMEEYEVASGHDMGDKRLQEWAYYSSILNIYRAMPLHAAVSMREMIKIAGSTPGFGWYNIALARACSYEGNLEDSKKYIDRAAGFKEVHIGTTLSQSSYEFAVNLLRLVNTTKSIQQVKFENKNWWWQPRSWYHLNARKVEKYAQQYLITNQFAANPERENVIYKLFSTESIVGFDEIWYLIKDFSTNFFYKKFETELKNDKRERVYKYYHLFLAKLDMEKGRYKQAAERLEKTLQFAEDIDVAYERLFLARVYEALAICADERGEDKAFRQYSAQMYSLYPQLVPYATFEPQMQLSISGSNAAIEKRLKKYRIDWTNDNPYAPKASLVFAQQGQQQTVTFQVTDYRGKIIVPEQKVLITKTEEAVKELAYGLFGIVSLDAQPDVKEAG